MKVLVGFGLSGEGQSPEVSGTAAPPCRTLNEQEESFPRTHRVAANENAPLRENGGAVCSDVSYALTLHRVLSPSVMKNKRKYLGFPCPLE